MQMKFGITFRAMGMATQVLVHGSPKVDLVNCIQILLPLDGEQLMNIMKVKHLMTVKQPGLCRSTG